MPDDDEEDDYDVDAGNEMVDMEEDDEAQPENNQMHANKPQGIHLGMDDEDDENSVPYNNKQMEQ